MRLFLSPQFRLRFVFALLVTALVALPVAAQTRGLVWEARKGAQRVVLVGTVHVGRPDFAPLPPALLSRAREAAVIAVEADPGNAQAAAEAVQRYALYGVGDAPLNEQLSVRLRTRLEALLPRYGLSPEVIWRMKPWFVAMNLSLAEASRAGLDAAYGTETQLFALAASEGKRVVEIESIEEQLKLMDSALASEQMDYLEQTVITLEDGSAQREVRSLAQAWANGDGAAMERMFDELRSKARKSASERFLLEQLLENRNGKMIDAIERFATRPQLHLVAVGSMHYFGPKGILNGLRQRGWVVTEGR